MANYLAFQTEHPSVAPWAIYGFDGITGVGTDLGLHNIDTTIYPNVLLASDGAKAWTLDGYYDASRGDGPPNIQPNKLLGSNIDIQLADEYLYYPIKSGVAPEGRNESILRVMIYAPADGIVMEGSPIYSTQVHVIWEQPVVTKVTLTPAADYAVAGLVNGAEEYTQVTATVKDQFGDPMPFVSVDFASTVLEGTLTNLAQGQSPQVTDVNGNAAIDWGAQTTGDWGVEKVVATASDVDSNAALIQWIYVDGSETFGDLVASLAGGQKVTVWSGFTPWNGKTLKGYINPGGVVFGTGTYVSSTVLDFSTAYHTWVLGEPFFVNASNSTNTDGILNWVYDVTTDVID